MKTLILSALAATGFLLQSSRAPADEENWPRSYAVDGAEVNVYEPQIEKWQGSSLDARFAIGVKLKGGDDAIYGSFAAHADALANSDTRTVTLFNFSASDVQFPDAPDKIEELKRIIDSLAPDKPIKVPLDDLLAGVPSDDIVTKTTVTTATQNKAPKVIVRFDDTVLVAFDGKPVFRAIPGTGLQAAVNTPATLLRPENGGPLYLLTNEGLWLQAPGWNGPWSAATAVPPGLDRLPPDHPVAQAVKNVWPPTGAVVSVPDVVTSETPAELLQIDGKPKYDRIGDLPMVRVSNTNAPLFYHFDQSVFYVLISGRWFGASELMGPWTYVPHNELPPEFAQIPEDDPSADVRASVAGTREAEEAVKEAQIPTYARVSKSEAPQIQVEYDGEPAFDNVSGTGMSYAVNTTSAVVQVGDLYYCCEDGVWFVSDGPNGPWVCATSLPQDIYDMPASSPLYHTRFVEVDNYDDDYVVYRTTPGYWGTYVDPYSQVCVYGTGWWYPSYFSSNYYCGHSWTYGLGCRYVRHCGFVRHCDRVAHTSWFRHTGRGSAFCRADSGRWGGRYERSHWRGSSGRSVAYSTWNGRVATRSDELASSFRRSGSDRNLGFAKGENKLQAVFRGHGNAIANAADGRFDRDVRAGKLGVFRHGTEGWQRRDSGKWKGVDKNHPVDARVAEFQARKSRDFNRGGPRLTSANPQGFDRFHRPQGPDFTSKPDKTDKFDKADKSRETRDSVPRAIEVRPPQNPDGRSSRGSTPWSELFSQRGQGDDKKGSKVDVTPSSRLQGNSEMSKRTGPPMPQVQSQEHRKPSQKIDQLPPLVQQLGPRSIDQSPPQTQRETPRRVEQSPPKIQREMPRSIESPQPKIQQVAPRRIETPQFQAPPQIHREAPRRMETPQPQIHREAPRQIQPSRPQPSPQPQIHREAPRQIQPSRPQPSPQPQIHREAPRQIQPSRPQPSPQPQIHREAPRRSQPSQPQSKPQMHREAPRHSSPPKPQAAPQVHRQAPQHSPPPKARPAPQVHRSAPQHSSPPKAQARSQPKAQSAPPPSRSSHGPSAVHKSSGKTDDKKKKH